jgi:hypothetical protein
VCGDFFASMFLLGAAAWQAAAAGGRNELLFCSEFCIFLLIAFATNCCYHKRNGDTIGRPIVMVLLRASEATNERFVAHIGILRVSIGVDRPASSLRYFWNGFGGIHVPGSRERPLLVQQFVPLRELALSQATEPRASCCGSGLEHDFVDDLL